MSGEKSPTGKTRSEDHRLDSAVERLVEEWASVVPSLDRDVRAIAARIARIDDRLRARIATVLKRAGLSDSEFRLLAEMAAAPGRVFSRELLLERVWDYDYFADARIVDVHIGRVRAKIEADPAKPTRLITVRGFGYKLEAGR